MMQTSEIKISEISSQHHLESFQFFATPPFNATQLMMVRMSINPQLLRLIFIDLTSEMNECVRAGALWLLVDCFCSRMTKSRPLVPLLMWKSYSWQGIMSYSKEKRLLKI